MADLLGAGGVRRTNGRKTLAWVSASELEEVCRVRELARYLEGGALEGVERDDVGQGVPDGIRIRGIQRELSKG